MRLSSPVPAFIVNLEDDSERRSSVIAQLAEVEDLEPQIVSAINGSLLSESACFLLTQSVDWSKFKGSIGCFMSHVKAWEAFVTSGAPYGIILEDDIDARELKRLFSIDFANDTELVFLNDRVSPRAYSTDPPILVPLWTALARMDSLKRGPGGDGYLLSRSGAERLLEACMIDTYFGHVDGRLLRYGSSLEDLNELGENSWIASVIRDHHHPRLVPKLGLLKGSCLSYPLVTHKGVASRREEIDP